MIHHYKHGNAEKREKRRNNLIIRGTKETKDCDAQEVDKIIEELLRKNL
jgi:hypothetical protein